jgi:hypothetical protein
MGSQTNSGAMTPPTTPTPDYGEPWNCSGKFQDIVYTRSGMVGADSQLYRDRIIACVNACAGMADPAAEIANLKMELDASCNAEHLRQVRDENKAMKRAIQTAYESLQGLDLHLPKNYGLFLLLALEKLQPLTTP